MEKSIEKISPGTCRFCRKKVDNTTISKHANECNELKK